MEGDGDYSAEAACNTAKPAPPAPSSVIAFVAAEHAGELRRLRGSGGHAYPGVGPAAPGVLARSISTVECWSETIAV
jgi:hypothetical protein